jgi:hypothetical protein
MPPNGVSRSYTADVIMAAIAEMAAERHLINRGGKVYHQPPLLPSLEIVPCETL